MRRIWIVLLLALTLAGCKTVADIKPDTIVDIPLHPTAAAETVTEVTAGIPETETSPSETKPTETDTEPAETEPPTEAVTSPPKNTGSTSSGSKPSGGTSSGSTKPSGNKKPEQTTATEPPTEPPTKAPTEPPTQPPTEAPTEPPTEAPTEAPSQPPTQLPTEISTQPPAYDPTGYVPGGLDRAVAEAVNAQRQGAELEPLTLDSRLCAIASVRAFELSLEWSHSRPDGSDGLTVLDQYGYSHAWAAESLYNGAGSGEKIVSRWMGSSSGSENILSASAAVIGVGTYTSAGGLTYVAAVFAG